MRALKRLRTESGPSDTPSSSSGKTYSLWAPSRAIGPLEEQTKLLPELCKSIVEYLPPFLSGERGFLTARGSFPYGTLGSLPNNRLVAVYDDKTTIWDSWITDGDTKDAKVHTCNIGDIATGEDYCMVPLPDGRLALGTMENTVKLFDEDCTVSCTLRGHSREVESLALLSDSLLASGSDDGRIMIWNYKTGDWVLTIHSQQHCVFALARLANDLLISGGMGGQMRVWKLHIPENKSETASAHCVAAFGPENDNVNGLVSLPCGRVASTGLSGITLWEPCGDVYNESKAGWRLVETIVVPSDPLCSSLALLADGRLVYAPGGAATIGIYDAELKKLTMPLLDAGDANIRKIVVLSDGYTLVSSGAGGTLSFWKATR